MKSKLLYILLMLPLIITAQKSKQYQCRTISEFTADYTEYDEIITFIGVRVTDNSNGSTISEYKYPKRLLTSKAEKEVLKTYYDNLLPFAKECPIVPTLEERYKDPYIYLITDFGYEDGEVKKINERVVETYKNVDILYYETVDTLDSQAYVTAHITATDSTNTYSRSNAKMLIEDIDVTLDTWVTDIKEKIKESRKAARQYAKADIRDKLKDKYGIENNRQKAEATETKQKNKECDKYKKGDTITATKPIIIKLCSGDVEDIEVLKAKRQATEDNTIVLTGTDIKVKVLNNIKAKIIGIYVIE